MSTWTLHSQEWEIKKCTGAAEGVGELRWNKTAPYQRRERSDPGRQTQSLRSQTWTDKKQKHTVSVWHRVRDICDKFSPKKKNHIKMTEVLVRILNPNVHTPTASLDLCMWVFWSLTFWIQWLQIRQSINQHQCPSYYSQIPPRAEISHRPQTWNFQ